MLFLVLCLYFTKLVLDIIIFVYIKPLDAAASFPYSIHISLAHATTCIHDGVSGQTVLLILLITTSVRATIGEFVLAKAMLLIVEVLALVRFPVIPDVATVA